MSLVSTSTAAYYGFTYDLNGNMTKQQDKVQGLDSTNFTYDALDRVTLCTQTGANDVSFATSHYDYDLNNNIQDTYRDEQAGKGERFGYDYANQLTSAVYNADNVQTPNPTNYDRSVSYTCDALNRTSMNDNGAVTNYTPNGLNQLTAVTGMASTYDQNFNQKKINGWVYTYDRRPAGRQRDQQHDRPFDPVQLRRAEPVCETGDRRGDHASSPTTAGNRSRNGTRPGREPPGTCMAPARTRF